MTELVTILLAPLVANGSTASWGYQEWLPFYNYEGFLVPFSGIMALACIMVWVEVIGLIPYYKILSSYCGTYVGLGVSHWMWTYFDVVAPWTYWVWLIGWFTSSALILGLIQYVTEVYEAPEEDGNSAGSSTVAMTRLSDLSQLQEESPGETK